MKTGRLKNRLTLTCSHESSLLCQVVSKLWLYGGSSFLSIWEIAPQSKADFAFLLHGYYHLKQDNGIMAIVLPHGVLFRGNAEGTIRKDLVRRGGLFDTVIGLPANIFF